MSQTETVEVKSPGPAQTTISHETGGPWWVRPAMQLGFMFVLILVLFGVYDLMKTKLPTLAEPVNKIAELAADGESHLERQANASEKQAEAAKKQAEAIERWVNFQGFGRVTSSPGPPWNADPRTRGE